MFDEAERIIISECARHGVPVDLVKSKLKTQTVARCRQVIEARLRRETTLSWGEIGILLNRGGKRYRGGARPLPAR